MERELNPDQGDLDVNTLSMIRFTEYLELVIFTQFNLGKWIKCTLLKVVWIKN